MSLFDSWVAAATALRRGFAANPYIAELLGGNPSPAPLAIWHGTNMTEPGGARKYIQMYGTYWHNQRQRVVVKKFQPHTMSRA